jgi:hypothetical protein
MKLNHMIPNSYYQFTDAVNLYYQFTDAVSSCFPCIEIVGVTITLLLARHYEPIAML